MISFACLCGARDERPAPAPDRVDCWGCGERNGMRQFTPGGGNR